MDTIVISPVKNAEGSNPQRLRLSGKGSEAGGAIDLTAPFTGPPPKSYDFTTRVIGGSRSPLCSAVVCCFAWQKLRGRRVWYAEYDNERIRPSTLQVERIGHPTGD